MTCGTESVFLAQIFLASDLDSPRRCTGDITSANRTLGEMKLKMSENVIVMKMKVKGNLALRKRNVTASGCLPSRNVKVKSICALKAHFFHCSL